MRQLNLYYNFLNYMKKSQIDNLFGTEVIGFERNYRKKLLDMIYAIVRCYCLTYSVLPYLDSAPSHLHVHQRLGYFWEYVWEHGRIASSRH